MDDYSTHDIICHRCNTRKFTIDPAFLYSNFRQDAGHRLVMHDHRLLDELVLFCAAGAVRAKVEPLALDGESAAGRVGVGGDNSVLEKLAVDETHHTGVQGVNFHLL